MKMTSEEDDLRGKQPLWMTTSKEDNLIGRQPHRKTTSQRNNLTGKKSQRKKIVNGLASLYGLSFAQHSPSLFSYIKKGQLHAVKVIDILTINVTPGFASFLVKCSNITNALIRY